MWHQVIKQVMKQAWAGQIILVTALIICISP
jgi:hypothetical protein